MNERLVLHPITLKEANLLVSRWHRHHKPPQGALFAIGCAVEGEQEPCGAIIVGRPVARMAADGWTAEVTRCVTNGQHNACSMLYRAAWRTASNMGYKRLITYVLDTEPGTSLVAAGFKCIGQAGGGSWHRTSRPRVDEHPTQGKIKWELTM